MDVNIKMDSNGWTPDLEELIADIEEKSWAYTWLHNTSVNYFSKWNDRLSVLGIGIDIATGTSTFATLNSCSQLFWVQLSTGVVIYIGAFIGGYLHYHRMSERIERHKFAASRYSSLYHNIQRERGMHPDQRQFAKDYITWVTNQYDSLLLSSPEIEDDILKRYFTQYQDKKKSHPVIYNYAKPMNNTPFAPVENYFPKNQNGQLVDGFQGTFNPGFRGAVVPLDDFNDFKTEIVPNILSDLSGDLPVNSLRSSRKSVDLVDNIDKHSNQNKKHRHKHRKKIKNQDEEKPKSQLKNKSDNSDESSIKNKDEQDQYNKTNKIPPHRNILGLNTDNQKSSSHGTLKDKINKIKEMSVNIQNQIQTSNKLLSNDLKNEDEKETENETETDNNGSSRDSNIKVEIIDNKIDGKVANLISDSNKSNQSSSSSSKIPSSKRKRKDSKNGSHSIKRHSGNKHEKTINQPSSPREYISLSGSPNIAHDSSSAPPPAPAPAPASAPAPAPGTLPTGMGAVYVPLIPTTPPRPQYNPNSNWRDIRNKYDLDDPKEKKEYFRQLKNSLTNRCGNRFQGYYEDFDNNLMQYQLNRMNNTPRGMNRDRLSGYLSQVPSTRSTPMHSPMQTPLQAPLQTPLQTPIQSPALQRVGAPAIANNRVDPSFFRQSFGEADPSIREQINFNRMPRQDYIDPIDEGPMMYKKEKDNE